MIELERTFLAKSLPSSLQDCKHKEIIDIYFPASAEHPVLRLRKNGDKLELTKKTPIKQGDSSEQLEQTIILSQEEFSAISKLKGKRLAKERYYFPFQGLTAEIDVYKEALKGLVVIDFEFSTSEEKNNFQMPDFCLVDITQEKVFAGGMLCGKQFSDLKQKLDSFGYKKLFLK
jgi:CYTH domain-containing protein